MKQGRVYITIPVIILCMCSMVTGFKPIVILHGARPAVVMTGWTGSYQSLSAVTKLPDNRFIANGVAKLNQSPYNYYWTSLSLDVPAALNINGDRTKFEVRIKNPVSEGAIEELDFSLQLSGEKSTANVTFIGRSHRQQFASLKVGSKGAGNVPELVQLFQDWSTVSLQALNNKLEVYKNGTLIKAIGYTGLSIGKLKQIIITFKGVGSVDWVRLYDTATGKMRMKEDFNVKGKSAVYWY